jgi:hypothetical protein
VEKPQQFLHHALLSKNANICIQSEPLLSPVEDYAATWEFLVLDLGGNCTSALEPRPVVNVAGGMR